jgi:hypothetical protein
MRRPSPSIDASEASRRDSWCAAICSDYADPAGGSLILDEKSEKIAREAAQGVRSVAQGRVACEAFRPWRR